MGAAAFFVAALLVLTGLGFVLTGHRAEDWVLAVMAEAPLRAGDEGSYRKLPVGLLSEQTHAEGEAPPAVSKLAGERVEMHGFARTAEGGDANGLWLVADPVAASERTTPVPERSVWIEIPEGASARRPIPRGAPIRALGVLRVGRPGGGVALYRLDLRELWLREPEVGGAPHDLSDSQAGGHDHDH